MSVDLLHDRIRKLKNPSVIDFMIKNDCIPPFLIQEEGSVIKAYGRFCRELMDGLKELVPAVRFSFGGFALMGAEGVMQLQDLLRYAKKIGYYVLLDSPEIVSPWAADRTADAIFGTDNFPCDGLIICPYIGSDCLKPFLNYSRDDQKDLYVIVRSPNKTASELQDLLTGSRHVYGAAAEMVSRFGEPILGKCGYSRICAVASAGAPAVLRMLRTKHNRMFLLVDGLDYPSGNAKNCSFAFDRFGHGAAVCAGPSVTAAWREAADGGEDYVSAAMLAAERMKKNLSRYITVL